VVWPGLRGQARRFARDGSPLDRGSIDLGIDRFTRPLMLAMYGDRPVAAIAQQESVDGYVLDSRLVPKKFTLADASGSGRTFAAVAAHNGGLLVAYCRTVPGAYGGSTRMFYKLVPRP
jgi:hypothetical protein